MIDPQIMHAIQGARKFVADELEVRERSYLPDENEYIASARQCLEELDLADTAIRAHWISDRPEPALRLVLAEIYRFAARTLAEPSHANGDGAALVRICDLVLSAQRDEDAQ